MTQTQQLPISGIGSPGLPLYVKEQLLQSPSVREGMDPRKEAQWRRQYTHFISDVGKALNVPMWVIYTAVFLCHHYFVKRSMLKNDRYLIATACLYLACKVQEHPKYLREVIKHAETKKWAKWQREHPLESNRLNDQAHLEAMRDQVLVAERAVLYTISFQLRIKTPYPEILLLQQMVPEEHKHNMLNIAWSLANDSLQTTLSLVYPPEKIAAACFFLAHEIHGLQLPSREGKAFCELTNITHQELRDISDELLDVYITVVHKDSVPGTPGQAGPDQRLGNPSSPDAAPHWQLADNRVRLVLPPLHQQPRPHDQQQQQLTDAGNGSQQQQQQQLATPPAAAAQAAPAATAAQQL